MWVASRPGGFDAHANSFAFRDRCRTTCRNASGIGAIALLLPVVLKAGRKRFRHDIVLFHQLSAVHDDDFRHWRVVLSKPVLSCGVRAPPAGGQVTPTP